MSGIFRGHIGCHDCGSTDSLAIYEQEDGSYNGTCWSECKSNGKSTKSNNDLLKNDEAVDKYSITEVRSKYKSASKIKSSSSSKISSTGMKPKTKDLKPIDRDTLKHLYDNSIGMLDQSWRGIKPESYKSFGVRFCVDESGEIDEVYYPVTNGYTSQGKHKLTGYHKRIVLPKKDFRAYPAGSIGKQCQLFGQNKWVGSTKLVLCGGEQDVIAAKQIHEEYRERRAKQGKDIAPIDFGCSVTGEGVMAEQIRLNYEAIDQYAEIILDMDADAAGEAAEQALLAVLPIHKVRVMRYPFKDANDALEHGNKAEYVRAIYNSSRPKIAGIVSSVELVDRVVDACCVEAIPLPPIYKKANEMLGGGLPLGEIINVLAGSGIGKTTFINEFIYHWIYKSPHKVGVLSYEATGGQFATKLLSRHVGVNINKIVDRNEDGRVLPTREKRKEFLLRDDIRQATKELFTQDGEERFAIIEDRDEIVDVEKTKRIILQLIKAHEVKFVIIDPVQDLLASLTLSEQEEFCGWLKRMKSTGVSFLLVNHSRKGSGGKPSASRGAELDEQDMAGSGALYRSGAVNIVLTRDKEHEEEDMRNTTKMRITKNRDASDTGVADELYFEVTTASLHNKQQYFSERGYG